ncbi:MAG: PD40 domain-containing protein [Sedimentisphaerales bacterium]|nr:PD40 domain-containing protein [Sedimentisphaerales bacterium]
MRSIWMALFCIMVVVSLTKAAEKTYMHHEPTGLTPKIFAPGIISLDDRWEHSITFTPDCNECYFTVSKPDWSASWIMMTAYRNGQWTKPEKASFSNDRSLSPSISLDGKKLFFSSNRDTDFKQAIWQCTRTEDNGWSEPVEMPNQISSTSAEWSVHLSDLGNMFICSWRPDGKGQCDGWRIPFAEGKFGQAENLAIMNTGGNDCGVVPGPKEKYVIFQSDRPGGYGEIDLYISKALPDGKWSKPRNLGHGINGPKNDAGPWITHDGKYLFFTSSRAGTPDIYWVRTEAFLPDPNDSP